MTRHKVVVTGASGFVAKNLRRYLVKNNVDVVSISRHKFRSLHNETAIVTDTYESRLILPKIHNADALYHLAGIGRQSVTHDYNAVNFELTNHLVNIAKTANVKRFVYTSGLGVSSSSTVGYFISKYKAERCIARSKIPYTILRPSYIIGRDDSFTKYLKQSIKRKVVQIPGSGRYMIQPVYINDVTKLFYSCIKYNTLKDSIIDLVGPETLEFIEYVKLFINNTKTRVSHIDLDRVYSTSINDIDSDFGVDDLTILVGNFVGDHNRLTKLTGMQFHKVTHLLESGTLF